MLVVFILVFIFYHPYPLKQHGVRTANKIFSKAHKRQTGINTQEAEITHIFDGDTVKVITNKNQKYIVRLLGINTPEIKGPYRDVECFGKEASLYTKQNLSGKKVKIETDPTQSRYDKYGRLLAYVFLPNGQLFNKQIIKDGYAYEFTYKGRVYKYQKEFKFAQEYARKHKLGLWANKVCKQD